MKKIIIFCLLPLLVSCFMEPKKEVKPQPYEKDKITDINKNSENKDPKLKTFDKNKNGGYSSNSITRFNKYCNERFSFCIDYPFNFISHGESRNGDGQSFHSKNGKVSITVWGNLVIEGVSTLDMSYSSDLVDNKNNISYKKKDKDYYVISGVQNGSIFYSKTIKKRINYFNNENTTILITFQIIYPIEQKSVYDAYCIKINKELK